MDMRNGNGRAWGVKVPKYLMGKWSSISEENVHLAALRAYNPGPRTGKLRFTLFVPINPPDPSDPKAKEAPSLEPGTYEEYDLDMANESVENQIVVAESTPAQGSRVRSTNLTGRVEHECSLRPKLTDAYRRQVRMRTITANTPKRSAKIMDMLTQVELDGWSGMAVE